MGGIGAIRKWVNLATFVFLFLLPFIHFGAAKSPILNASILLLFPSLQNCEAMHFYHYKLANRRYSSIAHKN